MAQGCPRILETARCPPGIGKPRDPWECRLLVRVNLEEQVRLMDLSDRQPDLDRR
jgi:hypothetical protein